MCSIVFFRYPAALEMTLHYFQVNKLDPAQDKRLRAVFREHPGQQGEGGMTQASSNRVRGGIRARDGVQFTPAMVEQLASEYEFVDEFIAALEARA